MDEDCLSRLLKQHGNKLADLLRRHACRQDPVL